MLDKEQMYKDLHGLLGEDQQVKTGLYVPTSTALVLTIILLGLLAWVGADIYQAVQYLHTLSVKNT